MNCVENIIKIISKWNNRPNWDDYFIMQAFLISTRSTCHKLKVGCAIVKNNRIISAGYNGHLTGANHNMSISINGHEQCTVHSEHNAIADASKRGISVNDSIIYVTHYPCINCFKLIVQSGIKEIKYYYDYKNEEVNKVIDIINKETKIKITKLEKIDL